MMSRDNSSIEPDNNDKPSTVNEILASAEFLAYSASTPFRPPSDDPYWENDPSSPYFPGCHEECGDGLETSFEEDPFHDGGPPEILSNSFEEGLNNDQLNDILLQHGTQESNHHISTLKQPGDLNKESPEPHQSSTSGDETRQSQAKPVVQHANHHFKKC
jgi:hypothetical protein